MSQSSSDAPRGMRTFLIIWTGQLISIVGSGLTSFALGVWIFDQTGHATPFALVVLCGALPRILLAPIAGSLADRWNRRWLMVLADTGDALVTLGVVLLLSFGQLQVWHVYPIALLSAIFAAFQGPAYSASIPMLVPKKDLARANGLIQTGRAVEMLLPPVLAGFLFGSVGMSGIIFIDFVTYFFAIGALLFVRIPQPEVAHIDEEGQGVLLRDALFGWNYLRARKGLLMMLLYFALVNFFLNFAAVLMTPLVLSFGEPSTLGIVQTTFGVGMLIGSVVMSAWGGTKRRIFGVIGFIALGGLGLSLTGTYPSGFVVGAGLFILLFCVPLASGMSSAIFQSKVALNAQGRVSAVRSMVAESMMPLAFLIAGPLADRLFEPWMREGGMLARTFVGALVGVGTGRGIGLMFVISGLALILASGLALANPRIRRIEQELADAIPDAAEEDGAQPSVTEAIATSA